jgi:hypothetical protein
VFHTRKRTTQLRRLGILPPAQALARSLPARSYPSTDMSAARRIHTV